MALKQAKPDKLHLIAATAALLLSAWSMTASAASGYQALCPETDAATLEIPATALNANATSHDALPAATNAESDDALTPAALLKARPKAALGEAVSDNHVPALSDVDESVSPQASDDATRVNTQVPGVSEDELTRYKRQMFRRDI